MNNLTNKLLLIVVSVIVLTWILYNFNEHLKIKNKKTKQYEFFKDFSDVSRENMVEVLEDYVNENENKKNGFVKQQWNDKQWNDNIKDFNEQWNNENVFESFELNPYNDVNKYRQYSYIDGASENDGYVDNDDNDNELVETFLDFKKIGRKMDPTKGIMDKILKPLKNIFELMGRQITKGFQKFGGEMSGGFNKIGGEMSKGFKPLIDFIEKAKKDIKSLKGRFIMLGRAFDSLGISFESLFENVGKSADIEFSNIGKILDGGTKCFAHYMDNFGKCAGYWFMDAFGSLLYALIVELPVWFIEAVSRKNISKWVDESRKIIDEMDEIICKPMLNGLSCVHYPERILVRCYSCNNVNFKQLVTKFNDDNKKTIPKLMRKMKGDWKETGKKFDKVFR